MLTRQQRWAWRSISCLLVAALLVVLPEAASAQDGDRSSFVGDIAKRVVFDPTTYAPALIAYGATIHDWNTSQPLFRNGFVEHNPRFTLSGRSDDVALGYAAG